MERPVPNGRRRSGFWLVPEKHDMVWLYTQIIIHDVLTAEEETAADKKLLWYSDYSDSLYVWFV